MGERGCDRGIGIRARRAGVLATALLAALVVTQVPAADAAVPAGFSDVVFIPGLSNPTAVQFAVERAVFVAQKGGQIYSFDSAGGSRTLFADLSPAVHDFWDRGLLGMALTPNFPSDPYVYVLYTYDAATGGTAPRWNDGCPTPPGATTDGCVVSGDCRACTATRSVPGDRAGADPGLVPAVPQPLHRRPRFGADGALYASAGDGASFNNVDYGQFGGTYAGDQANPCGDPPAGRHSTHPPTAEGGALRSQSSSRRMTRPRSTARSSASIRRPVPALPDNPLARQPRRQRRPDHRLRPAQPVPVHVRPGTNELWIGDVGWNTWEEIDRIADPPAAPVENFGWPC